MAVLIKIRITRYLTRAPIRERCGSALLELSSRRLAPGATRQAVDRTESNRLSRADRERDVIDVGARKADPSVSLRLRC